MYACGAGAVAVAGAGVAALLVAVFTDFFVSLLFIFPNNIFFSLAAQNQNVNQARQQQIQVYRYRYRYREINT